MDYLFFGIQQSAQTHFERIRVDNISFNENGSELIEKFRSLTGNRDEVSLVYLGNILEEAEPINRYNLRPGSTIHVLRKSADEQPKNYKSFTEVDVSRVCAMYRGLNAGNFHVSKQKRYLFSLFLSSAKCVNDQNSCKTFSMIQKISRPEVQKAIFDSHPELKKDSVAMSVLKDPILLSNMQNPDTVRKVAQHHRVLIEASENIVKALKSAKSLTDNAPSVLGQASFEDLSDSSSSSSSSGNEGSSRGASGSNIRRITAEHLRQSLAAATQNRNSLANISQRNLNQGSGISPSTSSGSVPTSQPIISSSMFMNAMNEVLMASRRANESVAPAPAASETPRESTPAAADDDDQQEDVVMGDDERRAQEERDIEMITNFQPQLRQMEELGFRNKAQNIQALMLCNGNLEDAVNFILTEMNSDMMD